VPSLRFFARQFFFYLGAVLPVLYGLETKLKGIWNIHILKHSLSLAKAILGGLLEQFWHVFSIKLNEKTFSELVISTYSQPSFKIR